MVHGDVNLNQMTGFKNVVKFDLSTCGRKKFEWIQIHDGDGDWDSSSSVSVVTQLAQGQLIWKDKR
jgi:hypothetical protein